MRGSAEWQSSRHSDTTTYACQLEQLEHKTNVPVQWSYQSRQIQPKSRRRKLTRSHLDSKDTKTLFSRAAKCDPSTRKDVRYSRLVAVIGIAFLATACAAPATTTDRSYGDHNGIMTTTSTLREEPYGSLEELRQAVESAGIDCGAIHAHLALEHVADAGTCNKTPIVLLIFATEVDKQRNIDHNAEISKGSTAGIFWRLIGPNWIIDAGYSNTPTDQPVIVDSLKAAIGGTVWMGGRSAD